MINRIVFTGDAMRTIDGEANQRDNVEWLARHFGPLFHDMTGLPMSIALPLATGSVSEWVELQNGSLGLDGWASTFWSEPTDALIFAIEQSTKNALVISIELPPVMQAALDEINVPWIDIGLSPLRFLKDFVIHVKCSSHFEYKHISEFIMNDDMIDNAVRKIRMKYCSQCSIDDNSLIFFGQTSRDRTLIRRDGCFCGIQEAVDCVATVLNGRTLLVKEHPWERGNPVVEALLNTFGGALLNDNTYAVLAASANFEVATLCSSVGREAPWFGKSTTTAYPDGQEWAYGGIDLLQSARSSLFWGPFLASAGIEVLPGLWGPEWTPNALRATIGGQGLDMSVWS